MSIHLHTFVYSYKRPFRETPWPPLDDPNAPCTVRVTTFYKKECYQERVSQLFQSIAGSLLEWPSVQNCNITHTEGDRCTKTYRLDLALQYESSRVEEFIVKAFETAERSDPSVKFEAGVWLAQAPDYLNLGFENCCVLS